jgi:hypothetical protein
MQLQCDRFAVAPVALKKVVYDFETTARNATGYSTIPHKPVENLLALGCCACTSLWVAHEPVP